MKVTINLIFFVMDFHFHLFALSQWKKSPFFAFGCDSVSEGAVECVRVCATLIRSTKLHVL